VPTTALWSFILMYPEVNFKLSNQTAAEYKERL
jgi:hypothetical protein